MQDRLTNGSRLDRKSRWTNRGGGLEGEEGGLKGSTWKRGSSQTMV